MVFPIIDNDHYDHINKILFTRLIHYEVSLYPFVISILCEVICNYVNILLNRLYVYYLCNIIFKWT